MLPTYDMPEDPQIPTVDLTDDENAAPGGSPLDSPQGVGQILQQTDMMPGPPANMQEQSNRAQGWQALSQRFKSDPAWQLALLSFGVNMMQPRPMGQTAAGHVGQSIAAGMGTYGKQKQIEYQHAVQDRQLGQTDKRIGLDEQRVGLEERRVAEGEKTGSVQRTEMQQRIDENTQKFPKILKELDAKIDAAVASKEVSEQTAELLKERVRLYPREIWAKTASARASLISAGKPTGLLQLVDATADAMVKSGEAKTIDEARSLLGQKALGKSGGAAGQNITEFKAAWMAQHPKLEDESDDDYQTRIAPELGKAVQGFLSKENYTAELNKRMATALPGEERKARRAFNDDWIAQHGQLPDGRKENFDFTAEQAGAADPSTLDDGEEYFIKMQDGKVIRRVWSSKERKFKAPK